MPGLVPPKPDLTPPRIIRNPRMTRPQTAGYHRNPYRSNPSYGSLSRMVLTRPLDVQLTLLDHVISYLEFLTNDVVNHLISKFFTNQVSATKVRQLGLHLYGGTLAGYGFTMYRLGKTIQRVGHRWMSCERDFGTRLRRIMRIDCHYKLDNEGSRPCCRKRELSRRHGGQLNVSLVVEHCLETAERVFEICQKGSDYVQRCSGRRRNAHTFLESDFGISAILKCLRCRCSRVRDCAPPVETRFQAEMRDAIASSTDGDTLEGSSNELLYGRAGILYTLLWCQKSVPDVDFTQEMIKLATTILELGTNRGLLNSTDWPLLFEWHGKPYLGACHGICGILYVLLQVPCLPQETREWLMFCAKRSIDRIIETQLASGNFPTRQLGRHEQGEDRLVQWCHGSPGILPLFEKMIRLEGEAAPSRWQDALSLALEDIWERGLLRKGLGLCHGISGNGYVFLMLGHLEKALAFAEYGCDHMNEMRHIPDRPFSLFDGVAGFIVYLLDLVLKVAGEDVFGFPGFDA